MNTEGIRQGRVPVEWRILERGDGGVIRLLYARGPATNILVNGVVIGQGRVLEQRPLLGKDYEPLKYVVAVLALLSTLALPLAWPGGRPDGAHSAGVRAGGKWPFRVAAALTTASVAALICLHVLTREPAPFAF